jgi:anhydro-N-acetylmuramic acid kinase
MSEQMAFDWPSAATAPVLAIGLMSGTSQDGVDVALIDTDGERIAQLGATACRPYGKAERTLLRRATAAAANLTDRTARPEVVAEAERLINDAHGEAVESFLAANGLQHGEVAVVGFPGQTLLHRPERHLTLQIGDGAALAARLGTPVVYDFRAADVAAGGQGAPLAPVFHRALVRQLQRASPIAVLNLGGVANITYIDGGDLSLATPVPVTPCWTISCGCKAARRSTSTAALRQQRKDDRALVGASVLRVAAAEIA